MSAGKTGLLLLLVLLLIGGRETARADAVKVKGLGLWRNLEMDRRLEFLQGDGRELPREPDSATIEDGAFLLLQLLRREGYREPEVTVELDLPEGPGREYTFAWPFQPKLPVGLRPVEVVYRCDPGILEVYGEVRFSGLDHLEEETALSFFKPGGGLFVGRRQKAFTEQNLASRSRRLVTTLEAAGYQEADIADTRLERSGDSGEVDLHLIVEEGPRHFVGRVVRRTYGEEGSLVREEEESLREPIVFTGDWLEGVRREFLFSAYRDGYPEATVTSEEVRVDASARREVYEVRLELRRGARVRFAGVRFEGQGHTRQSVLDRQTHLGGAEFYNILEVEEGRRRLLSLGIFRDVRLQTEDTEKGRLVTYQLTPGQRESLNLRFGWGSYEQGRAGIRWERINPFGRAHRYRLDAKRSFKDLELEGSASLPHFFDRDLNAFLRTRYLFREEISFERSLYDLRFQLSRRLHQLGVEATVGYLLEDVLDERDSAELFPALDEALVTSLDFRLTLDRRDSTLHPTRGYDLQFFVKAAAEQLGGEANFLRWEASASWHYAIARNFLLHLSARYGLLQSERPTEDNLPFGERFFPGGANSLRGYQRGEAAPSLPNGDRIGAEVFALANLEFEVRVTDKLSAVAFWDVLRMNRSRQLVPRAEALESAGVGLRWQSIVGPVRLEYGHNLDPRKEDPSGTLHFAVGYPF
ncbi:MAG: BamA/TamA family outer membrane protein [Verrucomicrobia bacterium]|jgi:outer membrane protein assembly factor BamA|nr:BamA/TamA family outer membrane protein [Verrucomicrobiota bacterium]